MSNEIPKDCKAPFDAIEKKVNSVNTSTMLAAAGTLMAPIARNLAGAVVGAMDGFNEGGISSAIHKGIQGAGSPGKALSDHVDKIRQNNAVTWDEMRAAYSNPACKIADTGTLPAPAPTPAGSPATGPRTR